MVWGACVLTVLLVLFSIAFASRDRWIVLFVFALVCFTRCSLHLCLHINLGFCL